MGIVYFDSNAFVKLIVTETDSEIALQLWNQPGVVVSSRLAYPEVRGTLARARRDRRLRPGNEDTARRRWDQYWKATVPVELTAEIESRAGDLADRLALRGADAVHLASAMTFEEADVVVVTWDGRLRRGVMESGLGLAPA